MGSSDSQPPQNDHTSASGDEANALGRGAIQSHGDISGSAISGDGNRVQNIHIEPGGQVLLGSPQTKEPHDTAEDRADEAITKLTQIVETTLSLDHCRTLASHCLPMYLLERPKLAQLNSHRKILAALQLVRESNNRRVSLLRFAEFLRRKAKNVELKTQVDHWILQAIQVSTWNLTEKDFEKVQREATPDFESHKWTHLMVMVEERNPESGSYTNKDNLLITMYWTSDAMDAERVDWEQNQVQRVQGPEINDIRIDRVGQGYSLTDLLQILGKILLKHRPKVIELFLPTTLMLEDLEFKDFDFEGIESCLAESHLVVRRFADRQQVAQEGILRRKALDKWQEKWRSLAADTQSMNEHHKWIDEMTLRKPVKVLRSKLAHPNLFCVSPEVEHNRHTHQLHRALLISGVPTMFWFRDVGEEIDSVISLLAEKIQLCAKVEFGQVLREFQEATVYERSIHILWDDPNRTFPNPVLKR